MTTHQEAPVQQEPAHEEAENRTTVDHEGTAFRPRPRRLLAAVLAFVLPAVSLTATPALCQAPVDATALQMDAAEMGRSSGGLFTVRRSLGVAFLAGSAILTLQGFDLKDEADRFYESYEAATDPDEIEKFYQRTTNRDVKSQVSWALATACGITGLRLLLTGGDDDGSPSLSDRAAGERPLSLVPTVTPRTVGLRLQRQFR
jgi:hypothetical protein